MHINISTLLDVAIGLIFIFFVFSIFVSGIVELVNSLIEQRAKLLRLALTKLLGFGLANDFFNHPLTKVKEQRFAGFLKPINYLSAESFSTVLIDLLNQPDVSVPPGLKLTEQTFEKIKQISQDSGSEKFGPVTALIRPVLARVDDLAAFKAELEKWYNGYMEQVSGWFKRYAQGVIWLVSVGVVLILNVDTIHLTNRLFNDDGLRDRLLNAALQTVKTNEDSFKRDAGFVSVLAQHDSSLIERVAAGGVQVKSDLTPTDSLVVQAVYVDFVKNRIDDLRLPVGWTITDRGLTLLPGQRVPLTILGWVLTAAALSFGAPFWFDLLLKLVNIRNTARRPPGNPNPVK